MKKHHIVTFLCLLTFASSTIFAMRNLKMEKQSIKNRMKPVPIVITHPIEKPAHQESRIQRFLKAIKWVSCAEICKESCLLCQKACCIDRSLKRCCSNFMMATIKMSLAILQCIETPCSRRFHSHDKEA